MNFKHWFLLSEVSTIKQSTDKLVANIMKSSPETISALSDIKDKIRTTIRMNIGEISDNFANIIFNFFQFHFLSDYARLVPDFLERKVPDMKVINSLSRQLNSDINATKDYLVAHENDSKIKSSLNATTTTIDSIVQASDVWHNKIAIAKSKPGREATTIIDLSKIGWPGWKWVSLDRSSCEMEGNAAGHCGNRAGRKDDNILSLRDPENKVFLTFIVNEGILGEMKARNNQKPAERYHPAIIQLLMSSYVKSVHGGGHEPENNFQLKDLQPALLEKLLKEKPSLDMKYYLKNSSPEEKVGAVNSFFGNNYEKIEGNLLIIRSFDSSSSFFEFLGNYTSSTLGRRGGLNTEYLNYIQHNSGAIVSNDEIGYSFSLIRTKELKDLFVEFCKKYHPDIEGFYDIQEIFEEGELASEIIDVLERAIANATEVGTYNSAFDDFKSSFEQPSENEKSIRCRINNEDDISIVLDMNLLDSDDINGDNWTDLVDYTFTPEYSEEMDRKAFVEYLEELIHEAQGS